MSSEKILAFLEKHVQWLVLGGAALYVGYMAYAYIYVAPSTLALMPGKPLTPDKIDPTILKTQIEPLDAQIAEKKFDKPPLTDVHKLFESMLNEQGIQLEKLVCNWSSTHGAPGESGEGPHVATVVIDNLFVPPPAVAKAGDVVTGRTVALVNDKRQDVTYASLRFTISASALADSVNKVLANHPNVPQNLFMTEFASIELLRQEKAPDGSWGEPVVVKPLPINAVTPYPGDKLDRTKYLDFKQWMENSQPLLMNPPFYKTATDADKYVPPGAAPAAAGPAPAAPAARGGATPAGAPRRAAPARPGAPAAGAPPAVVIGAAPPAGYAPGAAPAAPAAAGAAPNPMNPNGNPNLLAGDIPIIAHDETIDENKTYRYALRYRLYNPLFDASKALATPAIAAQFAIPSPDPLGDLKNPASTLWTAAVNVEPSTYVFVSHISLFNSQAEFQIFHWKDGHWSKDPNTGKKMTPGDAINNPRDTARWTLIDVRKDPTKPNGNAYVIIMNTDGDLQQRDENDVNNPKLTQLKAQAGVAAAQ